MDKIIGIPDVLLKYYNNCEWKFEGNDDLNYEGLIWEDQSTAPPTSEELFSKIEELKIEIELNKYKTLRKKEYPPIQEQLDTLYHQGYDGWKASIDEVKNQYPKPGED
jgi:hypothetical protein